MNGQLTLAIPSPDLRAYFTAGPRPDKAHAHRLAVARARFHAIKARVFFKGSLPVQARK